MGILPWACLLDNYLLSEGFVSVSSFSLKNGVVLASHMENAERDFKHPMPMFWGEIPTQLEAKKWLKQGTLQVVVSHVLNHQLLYLLYSTWGIS